MQIDLPDDISVAGILHAEPRLELPHPLGESPSPVGSQTLCEALLLRGLEGSNILSCDSSQ